MKYCEYGPRPPVSFQKKVIMKLSYLAGTLAISLIADLARGAHGVAVARLARLLVGDGLLRVAVVALLAVVAVSSGRVVLALQADAAGNAARQLEELHVEAAAAGVVVALAGDALVGREGGGSAPGPVEVEGLALLALAPGSIVLALASHFT
jgi:hypothetical protein